jgi:hypothetical protein
VAAVLLPQSHYRGRGAHAQVPDVLTEHFLPARWIILLRRGMSAQPSFGARVVIFLRLCLSATIAIVWHWMALFVIVGHRLVSFGIASHHLASFL